MAEFIDRNNSGYQKVMSTDDRAAPRRLYADEAATAGREPAAELNDGRPATWSDADPPGGYVCAVPDDLTADGICGNPVESEPCGRHDGEVAAPASAPARPHDFSCHSDGAHAEDCECWCHDPEIPVRLVQLWLCDPCLDGAGGECHTPGCSLWFHSAPDIPVRGSQGVTVMGVAHEAFTATPGEAAHAAWCKVRFPELSLERDPAVPWQEFTDIQRAAWHAAASAVAGHLVADFEAARARDARSPAAEALQAPRPVVRVLPAVDPNNEPTFRPYPMSARIARLQAEVTANRDALLKGAGDLNAVADERDDLRTDYDALIARLERSWPRCPDGCGCLMDGEDADRRECGCGGPCTMECRENGYPDAPSYRDLAVKHAMDEADSLRKELTTLRAEAEAAASSLITEAASQRSQRLPMLGTRLDGIARRLVNAASAREALEARDDG